MGTLVAASALIRLWFNSHIHIHMQHLDQRKDMLSEGEQALVCLDAWLQKLPLSEEETRLQQKIKCNPSSLKNSQRSLSALF